MDFSLSFFFWIWEVKCKIPCSASGFLLETGGRNGVLVVDMTGFTSISYNKAAQTATIGSGWRLGPLYLALWNLGKVTIPAGDCPTVGVAGLSLSGGWGFSSRKFGVVSDKILEAQVVIANGTLVTANAKQNSDLYFALRGAGATSFGKK
jgi:FAD/FMN-containing dehydrogenase